MTLQAEALTAILTYREKTSHSPHKFESHSNELRKKLERLVERDASESRQRLLNSVYNPYKRENFPGFPSDEKFSREEFLLAEYLYAPTHKIRQDLVKQRKESLKQKAISLFESDKALKKAFDSINLFSSEFVELKTRSTLAGLDRKTFFAVSMVNKNPDIIGNDLLGWEFPRQFDSKLKEEFHLASFSLLTSWGVSAESAAWYPSAIDSDILQKKVLAYAAIAGGTVLAAYALKNYYLNSAKLARRAASQFRFSDQSTSIPLDYGFPYHVEWLSIPGSQIGANQLAYQSMLLDNSISSYSSASDTVLKMLDAGFNGANYGDMSDVSSSTHKVVSGFQQALGLSPGEQISGTMLGSSFNMRTGPIFDSGVGGMATIYGDFNGKPFTTSINKIGNHWNINTV